mgnify:CR=1 FL=1
MQLACGHRSFQGKRLVGRTVENFIVSDRAGIHLQCFCHGYKKENLVCRTLFLKQGDLLTVTNRKKYIVDAGWFVLIQINNTEEEFMSVQELEEAIRNERIMSELDCMLKLFHISYNLDQSLACRNKEEFFKLSAMRNEFVFLYEQLSGKVLA